MKICLVNSLYHPHTRGGAEDSVKILAEYLSDQGHSVFIITTDIKKYERPLILREKQDKITIFRLGGHNFEPFSSLNEIGPFLRLLWHIRDSFAFKSKGLFKEIIDEIKPDLIWMHNIKGIGYGVSRIAKTSSAKFWLTLHDVQYYDPSGLIIYKKKLSILYYIARAGYKYLVKHIIATPDLLISPSQWLFDFYESKGLFKQAAKMQLLNPLGDFKVADKIDKSDNFKIAFAGQVEKHKGVLLALDGVCKYNQAEDDLVTLDVWGKGSLQAEVMAKKSVSYRGWVEFDKLPSVLQNYDLLIVPSLCYENSPTTIRLARLAGVPVLGANLGGIPELLDVNSGDYLFTPGSVDDFVKQLRVFKNRKLSNKLRDSKLDISMSVKDYWETLLGKL
jgi:glycosyltransferase involved in cell wall biosynthesis